MGRKIRGNVRRFSGKLLFGPLASSVYFPRNVKAPSLLVSKCDIPDWICRLESDVRV
jgi:hypothetical protein